ncbi:DUF3313 domain-containing protein [Parasalinivibrio latis]
MAGVFAGCSNIQDIRRAQTFKTYDDFRPGPDGGVDLVWSQRRLRSAEDVQQKLNQYDSVVFDQVYVLLDGSERYDGLDVEEVNDIANYFVGQLKALDTRLKKVNEPGDKTLRVSIALTNVETPNPVLAVTSSVLPVGLGISTISKVITGEHTNVGAASVEVLISDAMTGEPIIAAIDRRSGNKDFSTIISSTDDAKDAINWWVERLANTLNHYKPES